MGLINKTANGHHTSLLVRQHIPNFILDEHPKFVTFIEKYYEFMANNSILSTANSDVYYYGADSATRILPDIRDADLTDLDQFIRSFQKEYAYTFPQNLYDTTNRSTLLKNLLQFYQAVGTEDSFKMLFRLLFDEDIEIYYPKTDMLIASGGHYRQQARIQVNYVENLNSIENKKIVGANSGAYGTVERVEILPVGSDTFVTGKIENTGGVSHVSRIDAFDPSANVNIHDSSKQLEHGRHVAFVYMSDYFGEFEFFEDVYYSDGDSANTTVASNTTVLPLMKRMIWFENFSNYDTANSIVSPYDGRMRYRSTSTNPPWGTANVIGDYYGIANTKHVGDYIHIANTGMWHTTGGGTGQIGYHSGQKMRLNNISLKTTI